MNYVEFIETHLISLTNENEKAFRPVIDEALDIYNRSDYFDLFEFIKEVEVRIKQMVILIENCTASEFAFNTGVSIGTARKQLNSLSFVSCNKEKRPYIYGYIDE